MNKAMNKLKKLCDIEGMTEVEMIRSAVVDGTCPSICMNDGCNFTADYEPDSIEGWCDECDTNTVMSGLELAI